MRCLAAFGLLVQGPRLTQSAGFLRKRRVGCRVYARNSGIKSVTFEVGGRDH